MLSDQGQRLLAYCKGHEFHHYFCLRHLLKLLGSGTFVALSAHRLFFTSSEREYIELKVIAIVDFQLGYEEAIVERISCGIRGRCLFDAL
jgi:hypothetical protein